MFALDTSVLMDGFEFEEGCPYVVSETVISELNNLKDGKDNSKSCKARIALKNIFENRDSITIAHRTSPPLAENISNDRGIIGEYTGHDVVLLTSDVGMYLQADGIMKAHFVEQKKHKLYSGYKEILMCQSEFTEFCNEYTNNFDLLTNEYVIFRDPETDEVIEALKWNGHEFVKPKTKRMRSPYFDIGPIEGDVTQKFAFDSLYSEDVTVLFGKAGCGKTTLALAYLMSQLENNKISKIYIVHAFKKLRDSETLGFLPGNKNEKILNSGIGGILAAKLGSREDVLSVLLAKDQIEIIPTAELRGVEFEGDSAVFVTEAQNFDSYAMKTLIQRGKMGCKFIIEGDMLEQTDIKNCVNGMERLVETFKGSKYFSCVKLRKNNRNPIGALADEI